MKNKPTHRSGCPISLTLETVGDSWSLLIVRDIVYFGKRSFSEFLGSDEKIATNILSSRLKSLEEKQILIKLSDARDKRRDSFVLTEKGLDLIPILVEHSIWGAKNNPNSGGPKVWFETLEKDKQRILSLIRKTVQDGGSIFIGPNNLISQLGLRI